MDSFEFVKSCSACKGMCVTLSVVSIRFVVYLRSHMFSRWLLCRQIRDCLNSRQGKPWGMDRPRRHTTTQTGLCIQSPRRTGTCGMHVWEHDGWMGVCAFSSRRTPANNSTGVRHCMPPLRRHLACRFNLRSCHPHHPRSTATFGHGTSPLLNKPYVTTEPYTGHI